MMPSAPLTFCATPRCPQKVVRGYCKACRGVRDRVRGSRHQRGYTNAWAKYSQDRLAQYPWCVGYPAGSHGALKALAHVTDHISSARARPDLFNDPSNHQSLCDDCNKRKAIAEEGGFGW